MALLAAPAAARGRGRRRVEAYWLYDFGERWVAALMATCGRPAPGKLYRRLADPALPVALGGTQLLRYLLHRDDCSFDAVESRYESSLLADKAFTEGLPHAGEGPATAPAPTE